MILNRERQIQLLRHGMTYRHLVRPATVGDGIHQINEPEAEELILLFDRQAEDSDICRFVPASGAASRMFADLQKAQSGEISATARSIFERKDELPFAHLWKNQNFQSVEEFARFVCTGLRMDTLPKGMIPFHLGGYGARTAFEEQLFEAIAVAPRSRLLFTVPPSRMEDVKILLEKAVSENPSLGELRIDLSVQDSATDTICVDEDSGGVVMNGDRPFQRPGGHGALLKNLEAAGGDILFVKNIDNVLPERMRIRSALWKKTLAGLGIKILNAAKSWSSSRNRADFDLLKGYFPDLSESDSSYFHRPLRVCGMVRNTGEPGGGPFFVARPGRGASLQIVETAEIDQRVEGQSRILLSATHFNPVDLVCFPKGIGDNPWPLMDFADKDSVFISRKTHAGRSVKVLEYPGLWNGGMADWLTVFVEVPSFTFSPVKTVADLLRDEHRQG